MLAGHVWVGTQPGVFADLHSIEPGNLITVTVDGKQETFITTARYETPRQDLPEHVWGSRSGNRGLVLITCAGQAQNLDGHRVWSKNLIVEAIPYGAETE